MVERKNYIVVASVISALAVICLHTNDFWTFRYSLGWVVSNFIESVFYFAVPVFFMITGVTLFDFSSRYSTIKFFKKRINRTVIPFLFWSVLAIPFSILLLNMQYDLSIKNILSMIFQTKIVQFYWFFIPLFVVYLAIPVFTKMAKNLKIEVFKYCILLTFIINYILPFCFKIFNIEYNPNFVFSIGTGYISYCMIGYLIDNTEIKPQHKKLIYGFGIIGFLLLFLGTWILSYHDGMINSIFKEYLNFPAFMYSAAVFLFFKDFFNKRELNKMISFFSEETFNVYLLQYFFISYIIVHHSGWFGNVMLRFLAGIVLFVVISILSKLLKRIPGIKYVLPK